MKTPVFVFVLGYVLTANVSAQTDEAVAKTDETKQIELVQRVLQYEIMLDTVLSSNIALCIDERFRNAWMLPDNPNVEVSAQATERVRRTFELCQASSVNIPENSYRFTQEIRSGMENQLKIAKSLDEKKKEVHACLNNVQTQDTYKACLAVALPASRNESSWARWTILFDRRAIVAVSVPVSSIGNTLNLPARP